ncbi:MAG: orotidine-5'-phosphate decarboxylase [Betaproteobacteria bacterium]|nr:MAG: orotidine-5'-phosphate decarboxylase [Betaproteobacteria bacterium]
MTAKRVIVALDVASADEALAIASQLDATRCRVKVGSELFTTAGPSLVERLHATGFEVFLDLKFHDIPNTVASACRAAARLGVWMMNVHALGGRAMMEAARDALAPAMPRPLLIGVTVLTSSTEQDLHEVGIHAVPAQAVERLAGLVHASGLDGVVCSAQEAALLRARFGVGFKLVTPGIRPAGAAGDDQRRITSPSQAVAAGADFLVIGRPITRAANPQAMLDAIHAELDGIESSPAA